MTQAQIGGRSTGSPKDSPGHYTNKQTQKGKTEKLPQPGGD